MKILIEEGELNSELLNFLTESQDYKKACRAEMYEMNILVSIHDVLRYFVPHWALMIPWSIRNFGLIVEKRVVLPQEHIDIITRNLMYSPEETEKALNILIKELLLSLEKKRCTLDIRNVIGECIKELEILDKLQNNK